MKRLVELLTGSKEDSQELSVARERIERLENERRLELLEKRRELIRRHYGNSDRDNNNT